MDKKEFKEKLADNEYDEVNVLQLFGLQDDVFMGGSVEICHRPCGHTDTKIFSQGIYENELISYIEDYCADCKRKIANTVEFIKQYIEWLYVDVAFLNDDMTHCRIMEGKKYTDYFKSNINLEKFAKANYKLNVIQLMKAVDLYIEDVVGKKEENGYTIKSVKVDMVCNRITHFRSKASISRRELAEKTEIAFKTIENYELGRTKLTSIPILNAMKISDALGIPPEFLV